MRLRPRAVTLLAALLAGGLTDLIIFVPSLHFAYRSAAVHAMLETAATLIALLTTFLLWGRLRQRRGLDDLLLFVALGVVSWLYDRPTEPTEDWLRRKFVNKPGPLEANLAAFRMST